MLRIFIFCLTACHTLSLLYFPLLHFPLPHFQRPLLKEFRSNEAVYCNTAVRSVWQADVSLTVSPERCCATCDRCDHITPILRQLHWLTVRQRVLFKIAVLVFQCLAGQAPSYLSDDCQPVSDSRPRRLRSSDSLSCFVRRAQTRMVTGALPLQSHHPTLCRLNCNNVALSDNLNGVWRLFYSGRGIMALCDSL